jgi:hypothetical protein
MDKTHIPLTKWFWAIELVSMDKRGHSALSISRELEIGYPAAWCMLQRIRTAMMEKDWNYKLFGVVEMDGCFVGAAGEGGKRGRGTDKAKVLIGLSLSRNSGPLNIKMETAKYLTLMTRFPPSR